MNHCLLITGLVIAKLRILLQSLTYTGYTTMTENTKTSSKKHRSTPLTPREKEVLDLIFKGLENSEIATTLSITEKTVKNHINSIYTKLHIQNRSQALKLKLGKFDLQTGQYS